MNSPMKDIPPVPSATSTPGGKYDSNPAPAFGTPRSNGGLPIKMTEEIGGTPGHLDSPFTESIEMNQGQGGSAVKPGPLDTPFKDGLGKK